MDSHIYFLILMSVLFGFTTTSMAESGRPSTQVVRIFIKSVDLERNNKQKTTQLINNVKKKRKEIEFGVRTNQILVRDPSIFSHMSDRYYKVQNLHHEDDLEPSICTEDSDLSHKPRIKKSKLKQK